MPQQLNAKEMQQLGEDLNEGLQGLGFAIVVFEFGKTGTANYVSNGHRSEMIDALKEAATMIETQQDFPTPKN